ncbi:MAG: hypothetical protein Q4F85_07650 [Prevotella sp.]|nr:hypothetical protein [Prevotella sp.]
MRYIDNRNKEPKELTVFRETTPGATYDDLRCKSVIRQKLIDEQGYICAYCMGKITIDNSTIEHYIPQTRHKDSPYSEEEHKKQSLLYSNMCGVCVNASEHCDKKRGNKPIKILNPHVSYCEDLITYTLDGEIIPTGTNEDEVKSDINLLGLNCKNLKAKRVAAKDEVWKRFKTEYKKEDWTKEIFLQKANLYRHKQKRKGGGYKFHAYCNFIVWYFSYYAENYKFSNNK